MKAKKRKMSDQPHNMNNDFDILVSQSDYHRLNHKLSPFFTRPLYYGTSIQIGGPFYDEDTEESEP